MTAAARHMSLLRTLSAVGTLREGSSPASRDQMNMLGLDEYRALVSGGSDPRLCELDGALRATAARACAALEAASASAATSAATDGARTLLEAIAAANMGQIWEHGLGRLRRAILSVETTADSGDSVDSAAAAAAVVKAGNALLDQLAGAAEQVESAEAAALAEAASSEAAQHWEECATAFNDAIAAVSLHIERMHHRRRPFELQYHSVRTKADVRANKVTLEGGKITDKDGKDIWETRCCVSGLQIQSGAHGMGQLRYHSLSSKHADRSLEGHRLLCAVRRTLERAIDRGVPGAEDVVRELLRRDPRILDLVVPESNHPVFLFVEATAVRRSGGALADLMRDVCKAYGPRPMFGVAQRDGGGSSLRLLRTDGSGWAWRTFRDVLCASERLSRGIFRLTQRQWGSTRSVIATFLSENRPAYYVADLACVFASITTAGLHAGSWGAQQVADAIDLVANGDSRFGKREVLLFASAAHLGHAVGAAQIFMRDVHGQVMIICLDPDEAECAAAGAGADGVVLGGATVGEAVTAAQLAGVQIVSSKALAQFGTNDLNPEEAEEYALPVSVDASERPYTLMLTSGSTGRSKAVVVTESRWIEDIVANPAVEPLVNLSYTPSSLMADRLGVYGVAVSGGRTGFCPAENLQPSLLTLRPTVFSAPPIQFNTWFTCFHEDLASLGKNPPREQREALKARYASLLGGRCTLVGTGGSPVSQAVLRWMRNVLGGGGGGGGGGDGGDECIVGYNYACTEVGNIATNGRLDQRFRVGGPDKPCHFKLLDLTGLGYTSKDLPYPRGECLIKTPTMSTQYAGQPEKTRAAWDADGYYH